MLQEMVTRRQHYIPQFYLKEFSNKEGQLYAWRRQSKNFFVTRPEKICYEFDLYEPCSYKNGPRENVPNALKNCIEDRLSQVESRYADYYRKLLNCCETHEFDSCCFLECCKALCWLASFFLMRHPFILQDSRELVGENEEVLVENCGFTSEEMQELGKLDAADDFSLILDIAAMKAQMLDSNPDYPISRFAEALAGMNVAICEAPDDSCFITASMPLTLEGIDEDAYSVRYAYFPLSSKFAALFSPRISSQPYFDFIETSPEGVTRLNTAFLGNNALCEIALGCRKDILEESTQRLSSAAMRR